MTDDGWRLAVGGWRLAVKKLMVAIHCQIFLCSFHFHIHTSLPLHIYHMSFGF
jgi:hypothetical protein